MDIEEKKPTGQNVAYLRVSTVEQHLDRQRAALWRCQVRFIKCAKMH